MRKNILLLITSIILLLVVILAVLILLWRLNGDTGDRDKGELNNENSFQNENNSGSIDETQEQSTSIENRGSDEVDFVLDNVIAGESISSPLLLTGSLRGTWFWEGSFQAQVRDVGGNLLGSSIATAQEEWMSDKLVKFSTQIIFTVPNGVTEGYIVLIKENPSGLPENNEEIQIPVLFPTQEVVQEMMTLKVFFPKTPTGVDCNAVYATNRQVPRTLAVGTAALKELLKGLTPEEKDQGFTTFINEGVTLKSLKVVNGVAYADFDQQLQQGVGGSCLVTYIRAQISQTLKQFPTVQEVVISIDGVSEDILQP